MKNFLAVFTMIFVFMVNNSFGEEGDFKTRLATAKELVDKVATLKEQNDPSWETGVEIAYNTLRRLNIESPASPEVYLLLARCYYYNNRTTKAKKAIEKALFFNPTYLEVFMFKGDMCVKEVISMLTSPEGTYSSLCSRQDVEKAYGAALIVPGIDKDTESLIYLKLGDFYHMYNYSKDKEKAKELWQKAVSNAPDSSAAKIAQSKLQQVNTTKK